MITDYLRYNVNRKNRTLLTLLKYSRRFYVIFYENVQTGFRENQLHKHEDSVTDKYKFEREIFGQKRLTTFNIPEKIINYVNKHIDVA